MFASISPDYCFCYRALGMLPSVLYYDTSLLVNYASDRSNGASFSRGVATRDSSDFERNVAPHALNGEAPLPSIRTVGNAVIHEYCSARKLSGNEDYPDVELRPYLDFLAGEVASFVAPDARVSAKKILAGEGWHATLRFKWGLLEGKLSKWLLSLRKRKFETVDEAIHYATTHPSKGHPWVGGVHRRYGGQTLPLP